VRIGWIVFVSFAATCSARYGQRLLPDQALPRIPTGERTRIAGHRYDSNVFSDVFATGAHPRPDRALLIFPELPTSSVNWKRSHDD
jgi:hypothetical protein